WLSNPLRVHILVTARETTGDLHCARAFRRGNPRPSGLGGASVIGRKPDPGFSPDLIRQLAVQSIRHSSTRARCVRRLPVSILCRLTRPCNVPPTNTSPYRGCVTHEPRFSPRLRVPP